MSRNLAKITKLTERATNISEGRLIMEATLKAQTQPVTSSQLCALVDLPQKAATNYVARMCRDGVACVVGYHKGASQYMWAETYRNQPKLQRAAPVRNSNSAGYYVPPDMTPVRPGAADHESVPSRRADGLVAHRPLMCMGSGVRGI